MTDDREAHGVNPTGPERGGPELVVDCRGQRCPLPVITLARRITDVPPGAVVRVLADDPAAGLDIPAWCRMRGHDYLGARTVDGAPGYDVRRADPA